MADDPQFKGRIERALNRALRAGGLSSKKDLAERITAALGVEDDPLAAVPETGSELFFLDVVHMPAVVGTLVRPWLTVAIDPTSGNALALHLAAEPPF